MSVAVTDVQISTKTAEINVGGITNMNASVLPANATDKTLKYTSSDTTVATVTNEGVIVGVGEGTATITASSVNGKTASMQVTVKFVKATGVTVSPNEITVGVGSVRTLQAIVAPENASEKAVSWNSSAPVIATVDNEGKVTGIAEGTATITATTVDGGFTAECQVSVVKNDGMTITLLNPYKGIEDNSNTVLFGDNMLVAVDLKNGDAPAVGESVVLTMKSRYNSNSHLYEVKNKSAVTDGNGRAEFVVGVQDRYSNADIMNPDYAGIYDLVATRTKANDGTSITQKELTVNTATIESRGIEVVSRDKLEPADGNDVWKPPVNSTLAHYSDKYGQKKQIEQEYVVSQKVSPAGTTSHEVEFTVSANLKYGEATEEVRKDWTWKPEGDDGTRITTTVYNEQNDETTQTELKEIPEGINSLRINFRKINLSEFTAIYIDFFNKNGRINALRKVITDGSNLTEVTDSEEGKQESIQIGNLGQYSEGQKLRLVVSLVTKGQVKTEGEGYILSKVIGSYDNENRDPIDEHPISNDNYVKWEDVSNDVSYETKVVKQGNADFETIKSFIPGSKDTDVYTVRIPVFPYSGDAFISVENGNTYLYPTKNNEKNVNIIDASNNSYNKPAIQITNAEEATRRCSVVPVLSGNNAIVNSEITGMTALKATINIPGVEEDVFNSQNGKVLYTSVQWAPVTQTGTSNDEFYAVEGQSVRIAAQLCDINGNKVAAEGQDIFFSAGVGAEFGNQTEENRSIYATTTRNKKVDLVSELPSGGKWTTDRNGRREIELQGVMGTSYIKGLTARTNNSKYIVKLSILGNTEETKEISIKNGNTDIYWVALGLSYTHSADKEPNITVQPYEWWKDGESEAITPTNPLSEFPRGAEWNVGYLPIASITKDVNAFRDWEEEKDGLKINVSGVKVKYVPESVNIGVKGHESSYLTELGKNTVKMHSSEIGTILLKGTMVGTENDLKNVRFTKEGEKTSRPNVGRGDSNIVNNTTLVHTTEWTGNGKVAKASGIPSTWTKGVSVNGFIGLEDNGGAGYVDVTVDYVITNYEDGSVVSRNSAVTAKETDSKKGTKRGYISIKKDLEALEHNEQGYRIEARFTDSVGNVSGPYTFGPYYVKVAPGSTGGNTPEEPTPSETPENPDPNPTTPVDPENPNTPVISGV